MWKVGSELQSTTSLPVDPVDPVDPMDPGTPPDEFQTYDSVRSCPKKLASGTPLMTINYE